jgi:hypothetical protein
MRDMRKPRAFLVSVLTSILLAIEYVVADAVAWQLERHPIDGAPALANLLVLTRFRPFYVQAFATGDSASDRLGAFGAGLAVALVVFWFVVWTISRRGGYAALVGTWFAAIVATLSGSVVATVVWAQVAGLESTLRTQTVAAAFDNGLHWGFLFGWAPALIAGFLAAVLRTRLPVDDEPYPPLDRDSNDPDNDPAYGS